MFNDEFAIRCSKCNTVFGRLSHMVNYGKRICNKCCETGKFDSKGLWLGCKCKHSEESMLKMIPKSNNYKNGRKW